ncbi:hypothetical protein LAZ67_1004889 [Cordylochernes scorpioides]|uniref:Uncharacterized protein n=1 Tax=Cordylochernes scorpioides TaxID=51811 RepID=A0ABY6JZ91_9ARAC|nr:hypothetical protein LAZ67_1004889 [Cordylochernes scorpioides]
MSLEATNLVWAGSPHRAEHEPGRLGSDSRTVAEISAENQIQDENSRIAIASGNYANLAIDRKHANFAAACVADVTPSTSGALTAATNWTEQIEASESGGDGYTEVKHKRRRRDSPGRPVEQRSSGIATSERTGATSRSRPPTGRATEVQVIRATRADIADARARQRSSTEDNCVFVEHCPDFGSTHYLQAVEELVGGAGNVLQVMKMDGHMLVGLSTKALAERLIKNGLDIGHTHLRAFPFKKRAERITVGNLPFFVDDAAVIEALKPYGDVTSIVPIRLRAGRYTFTDGRREAFILLKEGIALEKIPTRVVIRNKGNVLSAFISYGVKCSRCGRQGHRRANCPINPGRASNNGQPQPAPLPPGASSTVSRQQNRPTPAAPVLPMEETPSAPPPVTPAPPLQALEGPVGPRPAGSQHPEPPPARPDLVAPRNPLPAQKTLGPAAPTPDVEMSIVEETSASSTSSAKNATRVDLDVFIERHPSVSFAGTDALGLGREEVLDLLSSRTKAQRNRPLLSPPQGDALAGLIGQILDLRPGAATNLYKVLGQVKAELRTTPAAVPTPPLPAPRPAEPAPPAPHGEKTTPDMATPPPPLSPRFIDERWREAHDIIDDLGREPYSEHLSELRLSEGDITDAIICPEDREPLLRRLSTRRKNILAEIISAAIERARDIPTFARGEMLLGMPSSASPGSSGSAGQEPGRPSIPSPIGGRISSENGNEKIISKENSENRVHANPPTGVRNANLASARGDVTTGSAAATSSNGAARVLGSWACAEQASGLINNPENEQVNMLVYCMGDNADDILLSCKIASDQLENYNKVIECFESHFIPRRNIIYERARFNQRCQQEGEKVNEFITALHSLAEHCNFEMLHDELIRDRIVVGVRDRALSERMQLDTDLTLVKATLMAKQLESVKEQQSSLYQQDSIDQIKKMPNHIKETKRHEPKIRQFKSNQLGGSSHGCTSKCKKKGHYAKVCRSEAINEINSEIAFLGSVEDNSKKWIVPIKVNNRQINFKIDTGADVNVLPLQNYYQSFQRIKLEKSDKILQGPNGIPLETVGMIHVKLQNKGQHLNSKIYIVDKLKQPLLSGETSEKLNIVRMIQQLSSGGRGGQRGRLGSGDNRGCYNCGEEGHRKFECTKPARGGGRGRGQSRDGGSNNTCYNCGEVGHRKYECTNMEDRRRTSASPRRLATPVGSLAIRRTTAPNLELKSGDEEESSDNKEEETPQKRKQAEDSEEEEVEAEEPPKKKSKKPKSKKKEEDCYLTLQAYRTMPLESARSREMRRPPLRHQPGSQGDARMTRSKRPRRIALHQRPHLQEMEGCRGTTKTRIQRRASLQCQPCIQDMEGQADSIEDQGPGEDDDFTVIKSKKRRRDSPGSPAAAAPSSGTRGAGATRRPRSSTGWAPRAEEVRTTRAHIAEARARQASSTEDHCVYIERSPELEPYHYMRAFDRMLGGTREVFQMTKMNGHFLVGLANRGLAERLVNEGLEVEGTLHRAFPFRKRAERITVGNLPFFVGDATVISALSPFGRVTSIAPKLMKAGPYIYNDGRREAYIILREGLTIERLPTLLDISIKGEAWPAYLSSGIRCSRCRGQGHRRANCPLLAGRTTEPGPATPTSPTSVPPATAPRLPQQPSAQPPPPASPSPTMEVSDVPPTSRAAPLPPAALRPSPPAPSALPVEDAPPAPPPVTPAPSLQAPEGPVGPRPAGSQHPEPPPARPEFVAPRNPLPAQKTLGPAAPTPDVEMSIVEETSASSTSSAKNATRIDLDEFIERHPSVSFAGTDALGLGREEVLDLHSSRTKAQRNRPLLSPPQGDTLAGLIGQILDLRPGAASNLYKVLGQVKAELRTTPAAVPTPPLPAPRPAEPAPPAPHGEKTTPDMATPPPPLSPRFIDERWKEAHDIIDALGREPYSEHLSELRLSEGDITDAIICPEDREPLLRRLSTRGKNILAEIIGAAIERARDLHPFAPFTHDLVQTSRPVCVIPFDLFGPCSPGVLDSWMDLVNGLSHMEYR